MADDMPVVHETTLIGNRDQEDQTNLYWHCTCGEVYHIDSKHPKIELAQVVLFKDTGKYYTEEFWRIPEGAILPSQMKDSPDFRRIGNGKVLVQSQEPWGFPHLL